jgi:hypothetical protein
MVQALLWQFSIVATIQRQCKTAASCLDRHHMNRKIQTAFINLKIFLIYHISEQQFEPVKNTTPEEYTLEILQVI